MTDYVAVSDRLMAAYNAKDFKTIRNIISPTIDMAHFNRNFAVSRADDLMPVLEGFASTYMPDRRFEAPERITVSGNVVVRESWWGGPPAIDIPSCPSPRPPIGSS